MLQSHKSDGIRGKKTLKKNTVSAGFQDLKAMKYRCFLSILISQPVAPAGKNNTACPCGKQPLNKRIPVHGWHIRRFSNVDKSANFAGTAPVDFSAAGKGSDVPAKQDNRRLQGTNYFVAIQIIQVSSKGLPRNASFYAYYQKQLAKGKTKPQALILISRRLIGIISGKL